MPQDPAPDTVYVAVAGPDKGAEEGDIEAAGKVGYELPVLFIAGWIYLGIRARWSGI
jgi:hypothetical protein